MFNTLIVQPIFNLLVLIYAIIPGHNFGMAIILFTVVVRLLMWPVVKKQLHQTKAMRAMQPELKRIKEATKGDKQKEQAMVMELYKEKGMSPFSPIGTMIVQLVVLIGLYHGLSRVVADPHAFIDHAYPALQKLPWMQELAADITKFDATLFGIVDLKKAAIGKGGGGIYWPAMIIVIGSVVAQYYQSKQLLPQQKGSRGLRSILRDAGDGKKADQSEVQAAVGQSTRYLLPGLFFFITVSLPSALGLYWLVGSVVAYLQQRKVLNQDEEEMEAIADKPAKKGSGTRIIIDGEVIKDTTNKAAKTPPPKTQKAKAVKAKPVKRRKK